MENANVKGKIVLCGEFSDVTEPFLSGAAGAVVILDDPLDTAESYPLPALAVSISQNKNLTEYIKKAR